MNALKNWMDRATPEQKKQLAAMANTTLGALRQAAGAWRTDGVPSLTPEFARRIELAAANIKDPELPKLRREQLCIACSNCEYAKKCNG